MPKLPAENVRGLCGGEFPDADSQLGREVGKFVEGWLFRFGRGLWDCLPEGFHFTVVSLGDPGGEDSSDERGCKLRIQKHILDKANPGLDLLIRCFVGRCLWQIQRVNDSAHLVCYTAVHDNTARFYV